MSTIVGTLKEDNSILVAEDYGMLYALTPCCKASGKGMDYETGVGCRGCYCEVDGIFGAVLDENDINRVEDPSRADMLV